MLIIQTGNIEKSSDILTFKDSMLEKDISKETEVVLKELDVFNPEVLITVSTNREIIVLTARVLAAESGNLDQFKIEFIDDNGNKFYQHLDDRGNLVGDDECWKITYQKDLIFRLVSTFYKK